MARNRYSIDQALQIARAEAERQGVPWDVVNHVIHKESLNFKQKTALAILNGRIDSPAGAIGAMQLMPDTARDLGVDPRDTQQNIHGGVKYLKQLLKRYDGNKKLAMAAYNGGMKRADKYKRTGDISALPAETRNYIRGFNNDPNMVASRDVNKPHKRLTTLLDYARRKHPATLAAYTSQDDSKPSPFDAILRGGRRKKNLNLTKFHKDGTPRENWRRKNKFKADMPRRKKFGFNNQRRNRLDRDLSPRQQQRREERRQMKRMMRQQRREQRRMREAQGLSPRRLGRRNGRRFHHGWRRQEAAYVQQQMWRPHRHHRRRDMAF